MTHPQSRVLPRALVSAGAIRTNLETIRGYMAQAGRMPALIDVAADAYGHGAELVTEIARELNLWGVARDGGSAEFFRQTETASPVVMTGVVPPRMTLGLADFAFRPALRLVSDLLAVKELRRGEGVSYGHTYVAEHDTRIALVTGGYAQGLVRSLGNVLTVRIADQRRPIVGRVAMDACVVDIGDARVEPGDEVTLLGDPADGEPGISEWVDATGMTAEELVTLIGHRARREIVA